MSEALKLKVDEFVKWQTLSEDCKKQLESLKADFQSEGIKLLETTKKKHVEFWGSNNSKVIVTRAESLKVPSHTFLKNILGDVLNDFSKEEIKIKYTAPFERILITLFQGDYVELTPEEVINQITQDEAQRKLLKKRLKGKFDKDILNLQTICGLDEKTAEHFAYFLQEAFNNERIKQLFSCVGETPEEYDQIAAKLKAAVIVDESIKIGLESEKEE